MNADDVDVVDCSNQESDSSSDDELTQTLRVLSPPNAPAAEPQQSPALSPAPGGGALDARFDPAWEATLKDFETSIKLDTNPSEILQRVNIQLNELLLPPGERQKEGPFPPAPEPLSAQAEFALRRAMPRTIAALARRGDLPPLAVDMAEDLLRTAVCICARFAETRTAVSEVYSTFGDAVDFNKPYHIHNGCNGSARTPHVAIELFNVFWRHKGFDAMTRRVADQSAPLSVDEIRTVLRPCHVMRRYLTDSFISGFADALAPGVRNRLSGITVEDLKAEKRDAIVNLCQMYTNILRGTTDLASRAVDEMNLHFAAMLITIPVLDKRFSGLKEIQNYALGVGGRMRGIMISKRDFAQWLLDNRVVENLFDKNAHVELIRRSREVLQVMAEEGALAPEAIELVWATAMAGTHESVQVAVFNLLGELSYSLGDAEWDFVDAKIAQIPLRMFSVPHFLTLARTFATSIPSRRKDKADPPPACIDILWQLAQETSPVTAEIAAEVQTSLAGIIAHQSVEKLRKHYISLALENVRNHRSVTESLAVILNTVAPRSAEVSRGTSRAISAWEKKEESEALHKLDQEYGFFKLFLDDLKHFKETARAAGVKLGETTLPGQRLPYDEQIEERVAFMKTVMAACEHIKLGKEEMEIVWDNLVANALVAAEREKAFQMMIHLGSKATPELQPIPDAVAEEVFEKKFATLNVEDLLVSEYDFFNYFFRYLNWRKERFQENPGDLRWIIKAPWPELVGINVLWKLVLEVRTEAVGKKALGDLIKTLTCVSDKLLPRVPELRESFLQRCVTVLASTTSELALTRALSLVRIVLDEMRRGVPFVEQHDARCRGPLCTIFAGTAGVSRVELRVHLGDTVADLKALAVANVPGTRELVSLACNGKPLARNSATLAQSGVRPGSFVHVINKPKDKSKDKDAATTANITTTVTTTATTATTSPKAEAPKEERAVLTGVMVAPETYDMFYRFLGRPETAELAWDVLVTLPSDQRLLKAFADAGNPEMAAKGWSDLLPDSNVYMLLYSLAIVESLAEEAADAAEEVKRTLWRQDFMAKSGAAHLLRLLMALPAIGDDTQPRARRLRECASKLTRLLQTCFLLRHDGHYGNELLSAALVTPEMLVHKLMDNTLALASLPSTPTAPYEFSLDEGELATSSMVVFVATLLAHFEIAGSVVESNPLLPQWLHKVLLDTHRAEVRKAVADGFTTLCTAAIVLRPSLVSAIFGLLVQFLDSTIAQLPSLSTCTEYFDLLCKLVEETTKAEKLQQSPPLFGAAELLAHVCDLIKKHPIVETRDGSVEDRVVQGLLKLACAIVKMSPALRLQAGRDENGMGLVRELYEVCLYSIPTQDNHGQLAPPKCKSQPARAAAFALLTELCRDCPENLVNVRERLFRRVTTLDTLHVGWQYQPGGVERSPYGYSGLRNLGCTCYLNATIQQLYMHSEFRRALLSVQKPPAPSPPPSADSKRVPEEKMLERLQMLFGFMQESERRAQDPADFIKTLKHDGAAVNPLVQMDAEEFLASLFDKLEEQLKGTEHANLVKDIFGGTICHQLVPTGCSHVREREEGFLTLQLVVQGKKNLLESLAAFVEGELLNGDNQYLCEECKVKRDTLKRCFLDKLPRTLFIHLKRFEYDLEDMRRIKVNDEYSFPTTLSLEPFTRAGIAAKEKGETAATSQRAEDSCEYELVGVVVHMGTADSGHYYSYIRERDTAEPRWLQFNDTAVEPFDPTQIPAQCFGGADTYSTQWDSTSAYSAHTGQKMYNAYMLVYQRRSPDTVMKDVSGAATAPKPTACPVPKNIFETVWDENVRFLEDKHTFATENFNFVWDIVSLGAAMEASMPVQAPPLSLQEVVVDETALRNVILATRFLFDTVAHAKEHAMFKDCATQLGAMYERNIPACMWLLTKCVEGDWPKQLLLDCPADDVRSVVADLFSRVLTAAFPMCASELLDFEPQAEPSAAPSAVAVPAKPPHPLVFVAPGKAKTLVARFMDKLVGMLRDIHASWRSFGQFFIVFERFATLGAKTRDYLLQRHVIAQLLDLFLGDQSPYAKYTPKRPKMGDKSALPLWTHLVGAVAAIAHSCGQLSAHRAAAADVQKRQQLPCTIPDVDMQMLTIMDWYTKALIDGTSSTVISELLTSLVWDNIPDSDAALEALTKAIDATDYDLLKPLFDVVVVLLRIEDSLQGRRTEMLLKRLLEVISVNAQYAKATQTSLRFVHMELARIPSCRAWLWANRARWAEKWLITFNPDNNRELAWNIITAVSGCSGSTVPEPFTPEQAQAETELLSMLLDMIPTAIKNVVGYDYDTRSPPKLQHYVKLLSRSLRISGIPEHTSVLVARIGDVLKLLWELDLTHKDTDEVKHELTAAVLELCTKNAAVLAALVAGCPEAASKLLSWHISIRPVEYYRSYNRTALATLYQLVDLVSQQPGAKLVFPHRGISFAIANVVLDSHDYPEAANAVLAIVRRVIKADSASYRAIHDEFLPVAATHTHVSINPLLILRFIDLLLDTPAEGALFCEKKGLSLLTQVIDQESPIATQEASECLLLAFDLAHRALHWTTLPEFAQNKAALLASIWDADRAAKLVWALTRAYRRHPHLAKGAVSACELALSLLPAANSDVLFQALTEGLLTPRIALTFDAQQMADAQEASLGFRKLVRGIYQRSLPAPPAVSLALALITSEPTGGDEDAAGDLLQVHAANPAALEVPTLGQEKCARAVVAANRQPLGPKSLAVLTLVFSAISEATAEFVDEMLAALSKEIMASKAQEPESRRLLSAVGILEAIVQSAAFRAVMHKSALANTTLVLLEDATLPPSIAEAASRIKKLLQQ